MTIAKSSLLIAGLNVNVYSLEDSDAQSSRPVAVLFLMHGRTSSTADVEWAAEQVLNETSKKYENDSTLHHDLLVVTFDHRNHGSRLVDVKANIGWHEFGNHNERHAIQVGTSRDISTIIDFLPSFLYPNDERSIVHWIASGVSLGGHSTWIALRTEPRVRVGIPIIGGADYASLLSERAKKAGLSLEPPHFPNSLRPVIEANDPVRASYEASDSSNPFLGKKVLALCGGDDTLVPWSATEPFFRKLNVGPDGLKKVVVAPGVGHRCTPDMIHQMTDFIWEQVLTSTVTSSNL
ncbi:unnamed protein product [Somion occarium]|uniref:Uncharacterized protein n=1 Tax=Somion occarium TaxID=3059160 RepID=A0ABP1E6N7_9APHY